MRKLVILLLLASLTFSVVSQEASENGSFRPEEEPQDTGPAICGDDICKDIEEGVCPQDCQEGYTAENSENSSNSTETQRTERKSVLPVEVIVAVSGGVITFILGLVVLLKSREDNKEEEDDGLDKWIQQQLNDGYSYAEVKKFLRNQGYSEEEIEDAYRNSR